LWSFVSIKLNHRKGADQTTPQNFVKTVLSKETSTNVIIWAGQYAATVDSCIEPMLTP